MYLSALKGIWETGPNFTQLNGSLDPLQFAYQDKIGVTDAIIYNLLYRAYSHLDKPETSLRILYFDFSNAFNSIQPAQLGSKLSAMQVQSPLVSWITGYFTDRPQYLGPQGCVSETVLYSTGAPRGTILSPFLFTLYTSDFRYNTEGRQLQKFTDDSAIVRSGMGRMWNIEGLSYLWIVLLTGVSWISCNSKSARQKNW